MRKSSPIILLLLLASLTNAQIPLERFVNHPALKHASVGVSVVDMENGRSIVSYDAEKSLTPASTMKLVTTATALETLGDNYRYKTHVAGRQGVFGLCSGRPVRL